jgi:hypothetical protein
VFFVIFILSFHSLINLDQWYQSSFLFVVSPCMSSMRSRYKELGLELVELGKDHSFQPKQPPMVEEKRDDGAGDPIKMLLEESLTRQRNEMMDNSPKSFDDY